jgi:hypothetical protein
MPAALKLLNQRFQQSVSYPYYNDLELYDDLELEDKSANDLTLALKFCQG